MNILSIKGLRKTYPAFSLEGLDLELPAGCIMGLIGENGAGKSTTIKSILRLIRPDGGEIRILGKPVSERSMEDVGVVLDEGCLPEKATGAELGRLMSRCYRNWDQQQYERLLQKLSLDPGKGFRELSRGMRMKLSLALAMSHGAKLLILDEPTSGLDVAAREQVLDLLLDFISDGEKSVLITSHIVTDLEKICDYICFIHQGRRLFLEEKDELLEKYRVVHCTRAEFDKLPADAVIGSRLSHFGAEALMESGRIPQGLVSDRAGIEEIILFHIKEEQK